MDAALSMLAASLLVPTILFFVLGMAAAGARSDLSIPDGAAKVMSIYLLFAIGFKGGASLIANDITWQIVATLFAGAILSFLLPFVAFFLLRLMTKLDDLNAAAVAGHYGSISIVTFVTASSLLELNGIVAEGYLVAVAAVMEVPAILSALWIAGNRGLRTQSAAQAGAGHYRKRVNRSVGRFFSDRCDHGTGGVERTETVHHCSIYRYPLPVPAGHGTVDRP